MIFSPIRSLISFDLGRDGQVCPQESSFPAYPSLPLSSKVKRRESNRERTWGHDVFSTNKYNNEKMMAISSGNLFWKGWDLMVMIVTLFVLLDDILSIRFANSSSETHWAIKVMIDALYYTDIFFNFMRAPTNDKNGEKFVCAEVAQSYFQ